MKKQFQLLRYGLGLAGLAKIILAIQSGQAHAEIVFGNCVSVDFPNATAQELWEGFAVETLNTEKLLGLLESTSYSHQQTDILNTELLRDRAGGMTFACHSLLDAFAVAAKEPFYARLFNAVLAGIPHFQLAIQPPVQTGRFGYYESNKNKLTFYIQEQYLSSTVLDAELREGVRHENIHALFHAETRRFGAELLRKGPYLKHHYEKFDSYMAHYSQGVQKIYYAKVLLVSYYSTPDQLTEQQTQYIESLIKLAQKVAQEDGIPLFKYISTPDDDLVVNEKGKLIFRETLRFESSDNVMIYDWPLTFMEDYKIDDERNYRYIAFENTLLTYLNIVILYTQLLSTDEYNYKTQLFMRDPQELFAMPFGAMPLPLAREFFDPLYDELLVMLVKVEQNIPHKPIVRQWDHSLQYHPQYVVKTDLLYENLDKKMLTARNVDHFVAACDLVLRTQDQRKYFLAEGMFKEIINMGLTANGDKADIQVKLARVVYQQDRKKEAYNEYHKAAKSALQHHIAFSREDLNNYIEVHRFVSQDKKFTYAIKSGDANMIGNLEKWLVSQSETPKATNRMEL